MTLCPARVRISLIVVVLGLVVPLLAPAAHASGPERATASADVERVAGEGRESTAVSISAAVRDTAETVVVVRGDLPPDALTASPLAAAEDAPVLLAGQEGLSSATLAEIRRLGASDAVVVGGEQAVSPQTVEQLEDQGLAVRRIAGASRFDTAAQVAASLASPAGGDAILVRGTGEAETAFADAVAASALAARTGAPILLTATDDLPEVTRQALTDLRPERVIVVGGEAVVSRSVVAEVEGTVALVERLAGQDRYATSQAVLAADRAEPDRDQFDTVWVATGRSVADALAAGPAAAAEGGGLLLVDGLAFGGGQLEYEAVAGLLHEVDSIRVAGGTAVITDAILRTLGILRQGANPTPGSPPSAGGLVECGMIEPPPSIDGPLSEDPVVAQAQVARAERGLPSDVDTVERLLADPATAETKFGFPATREEIDDIFARNEVALTVGPIVLEYAAREAPDTYAGAYLDQRAGGLFTVLFTEDADRHLAALRELAGPDAPLATREVDNSLALLAAIRSRIVLPDRPGEDAIVAGHGIDVIENRIAIDVVAPDDVARDYLAGQYGADQICISVLDGPGRSEPPGGGVEGAIALPSTEIRNGQLALLADVQLVADPDLDGGCVWYEEQGEAQAIIWPPKYAVLFTDDGFEILDEDGAVVADQDDRVSMGGGLNDVQPDRCNVDGDGDRTWVAGSVRVADDES